MSHYNVNVNESPSHFMILDAIGNRGMTNINNIAKVTKLNNKTQIELIVNDLFNQRLIVKIETLDRRKKTEIRITETGLRLLNTKKQELEQKSEQIQRWYNNGDRSRLESFMGSNRAW
ncbi:MAG: MarR family transcriptional regulator, partial [Candidatus Nitrosopolaris sp.]